MLRNGVRWLALVLLVSFPVVASGQDVVEEVEAPEEEEYVEGEAVAQAEDPQSLNRASDYYLMLGDRAFREGRYADAVHYYAKAVEFAPDNGILHPARERCNDVGWRQRRVWVRANCCCVVAPRR